MNLTQTHAVFEQTSHTLLGALHDERTADEAIAEITRLYWPPVYAYLRRKGHPREQAAELTQGFFTEKVIQKRLLCRIDPSRGTLRGYLCSAISNYTIDEHRKNVTRGKSKTIPLEKVPMDAHAPESENPQAAFDLQWAAVQLEEAMRRCEQHYRSTGKDRHWEAFMDRVYLPSVRNTTPTPLRELAERLDFPAAANAAAAIQQVRKRAIAFLQEVISESSSPGPSSSAEFQKIIEILGV
jgi:RNA polymerase sigma-70 factor (ECF subfamily)